MKVVTLILVFALVFISSGCASPVKHYTPSGPPEVTINGRVGKILFGKITNGMLNSGCHVKTSTDTLLVFEKPIENTGASSLQGSQDDSTAAARITYNIIETESFTRVVVSLAAVTNPGSETERTTPLNNSQDSKGYQAFLDRIKKEIELQQPQQQSTESQVTSTREPTTSTEIQTTPVSSSTPQRKIIGYKVDTSKRGPDGKFLKVPVYEDEEK